MALLESVKPFWPLLFTFVLPRVFGYYQALKTAYRTRPPARPLPAKASRSLNILFVSTVILLYLSISSRDIWRDHRNVFAETKTRLNAPTDLLFSRLALQRPSGILSQRDEDLRSKLNTVPLRQIYLRYGPQTLMDCPFCHPDQPLTYALHYLPTNILFPHLVHFVTIGLATSKSISGTAASTFRLKYIIASLVLISIDIGVSTVSDLPSYLSQPQQQPGQTPSTVPQSYYEGTIVIRPVLLALLDILLAGLIYVSATNRFIFFPFLASSGDTDTDPEELLTQTNRLLNETGVSLQMAQMKLRGLNVARNAVVRDEGLKNVDLRYWETVRAVEGSEAVDAELDESVFEDEEVQRAMARAFGSGSVDVAKMRREATGFVDNVTRALD